MPIAKAMLMGGVTRRFPTLNFAFLEGGAAWAVIMLADVIARFEKRGGANIHNLDAGAAPTPRPSTNCSRNTAVPATPPTKYGARRARCMTHIPRTSTSVWRLEAKTADDIVELFVPASTSVAKPTTRPTRWAVTLGANSPAVCGCAPCSGPTPAHWDVPDARKGYPRLRTVEPRLDHCRLNFRDLRVRQTPSRLHGGMNPQFFDGTAVRITPAVAELT